MMTNCPECELPVSSKAISCPHCGFPLNEKFQTKSQPRKKRMRLPNGFGQISEIKNANLRNRYRAMVTVGKTELGKPICKILKPQGYFATYNEAYAALVEYNKSPYDLSESITVGELHAKWLEHDVTVNPNSSLTHNYGSAWKRCTQIYNMRVVDVRVKHLKHCLEQAPTPVTKKMMKNMLNLMFDYALSEGFVERNYAREFQLDKNIARQIGEGRQEHVAFSLEELTLLWENITEVPYVDIILIQCYMGWRPQELCTLKLRNINLEQRYIVGGMKTIAGKMRTVPIHDRIYPLVERRFQEASFHNKHMLVNCFDSADGNMTYSKYRERFHRVMKELGIEGHRPHDPRKTFVTMCKEAGVDEYAIKHMVGHTINDITESVYTERSLEWLAKELSKI